MRWRLRREYIWGDARLRIILAPSSGRGRRAKRGGVGILACENTASRSQPPPLRGTSFQRKEGEKWSALTGNWGSWLSWRFLRKYIWGDARLRIILAPSSGRGRRAKRGGVGFPACETTASRATLRPFGAPPSKGRREKRCRKIRCLLVSQSLSLILSHQSLYPP